MATPTRTLGQDLKAWAAEQLQIESGAAPAQVRAAYLRHVEHENGGPNLSAREAFLILSGRTNAARPALALEAAEESLQKAVDDFAARFFSMDLGARRAEWRALKSRGQGLVRVDARLAALEPALDIDVRRLEHDPDVGEVVSAVTRLFVLRPAARAAARQALLAELQADKPRLVTWIDAIHALRERYEAIEDLEPVLIARVADSSKLLQEKLALNRRMRALLKAAPAFATGGGGGGSSRGWLWVLLPILLGISTCVRFMGTNNSRVDPPAPQGAPVRSVPQFKFPQDAGGGGKDQFPATERVLGKDFIERHLRKQDQPADAAKEKQQPP